jgi:hypothetical protein
MSQPTRDQVLIGYSHKDREWLKKLQTMLKPLVRKKLAVWDDTKIKAGAKWKNEIEGTPRAPRRGLEARLLGADLLQPRPMCGGRAPLSAGPGYSAKQARPRAPRRGMSLEKYAALLRAMGRVEEAVAL